MTARTCTECAAHYTPPPQRADYGGQLVGDGERQPSVCPRCGNVEVPT